MRFLNWEISLRKIKTRQYQGAKINRLTADWLSTRLTSDAILRWALPILRDRSRDFERNNDYFRNYLRKLEFNIIGQQGIVLQSKTSDIKLNAQIESEWALWGKQYASVCRTLSFRDVCKLLIRSVARDGEVLVRIIKGDKNNPYGVTLQVLEADHLDEAYNQELANGNRIVMGVEKDITGKPLAYWLLTRHPGDAQGATNNSRVRIPADEIIHLFIKERPTQTRGIPWIASAISKLRMLSAYEEAEVTAARVGASKMGFFTTTLEGLEYTGDREDGVIISEVEPGILEKLPPGVDFKAFDPGSPSAEFSDFVKAMLRGISAGLGCNYNTLCNDLEGVNYSSLRAGMLDEREYWMDIQQWFIDAFLERLYPIWFSLAALAGRIDIPYTGMERYIMPQWQAKRWDWVDPLRDVEAKMLELKNGLTTRSRICAEKGISFEDILEELKMERELMSEYGISIKDIDKDIALIVGGTNGDRTQF